MQGLLCFDDDFFTSLPVKTGVDIGSDEAVRHVVSLYSVWMEYFCFFVFLPHTKTFHSARFKCWSKAKKSI